MYGGSLKRMIVRIYVDNWVGASRDVAQSTLNIKKSCIRKVKRLKVLSSSLLRERCLIICSGEWSSTGGSDAIASTGLSAGWQMQLWAFKMPVSDWTEQKIKQAGEKAKRVANVPDAQTPLRRRRTLFIIHIINLPWVQTGMWFSRQRLTWFCL